MTGFRVDISSHAHVHLYEHSQLEERLDSMDTHQTQTKTYASSLVHGPIHCLDYSFSNTHELRRGNGARATAGHG